MLLLSFILFVIGGSWILVNEDGPFDVLLKIRNALPDKINPFKCEYCTSVWLGILAGIYLGDPFLPFVAPGIIRIYNDIKDYLEL